MEDRAERLGLQESELRISIKEVSVVSGVSTKATCLLNPSPDMRTFFRLAA